MKHGSIYSLALIALAMAAVATGPNAAAATATGPYYATPSWDQTLPSNTRFIVLSNFSNQAVLDRETGLVWEQSPGTTTFIDWSHATDHCSQVTTGNRLGWRVPTISELASLVDPSIPFPGPTVPSGIFSNVQANSYWTATTWNAFSGSAWYVDFSEGRELVADKFSTNGLFIWCVRGGQGVNSQ